MRNKILLNILNLGLVASVLLMLPQGVHAQNSSLIPDSILRIFELLGTDGRQSASFISSRIRVGLIIALALLILIAVVYALLAAFKYIQSQGDPGKIEEAQKAIKAIFYGVAAMMIGIVGIVLVFVFFSASRPDASLFQTCISEPNSYACTTCVDEDASNDTVCSACEDKYEADQDPGVECTKLTP
jgi:fumarate reductase subunit D